MSQLDSDSIDTLCVELKGHNNWSYADKATINRTKEEFKSEKEIIIIFHDKPSTECDECGRNNDVQYHEVENQNLCYTCRKGHGEAEEDCRECTECVEHGHDCCCDDGPYYD